MNNKSFDSKRIAIGYAKDRPWLHPYVIQRIQTDCDMNTHFTNGLDVGCGAGLSTKALRFVCDKVTGTDISEEMIRACRCMYDSSDYSFYVAKAEETLIPDRLYDIVTAAGVINWVDKDEFLHNMKQVMGENGLLIVYDFWISNRMEGVEKYTDWWNHSYLVHFPKPPRKEDIWKQEDLLCGFHLKKQVTYEMTYEFDMQAFIRFMMIQSNVNAQIESGQKDEEEVRQWMEQTLSPIFNHSKRKLIFEGYSWYIEKI